MDAQQVIELLGLQPHPEEGGYFVETWRDTTPVSFDGVHSTHLHTAIYYLLTGTAISSMHKLPRDEVFHFYAGDPIEQLQLHPDGSHSFHTLGNRLDRGERPQVVVPGGSWQGAILKPGGKWALIGCTMAPGFAYQDYVHGSEDDLAAEWPKVRREIRARLF